MENRWTDDHGPDRIYKKFNVTRVSTGKPVPRDEFVFVLRPERDEAAFHAMAAYSAGVRGRAPRLADQITEQLDRIQEANASA